MGVGASDLASRRIEARSRQCDIRVPWSRSMAGSDPASSSLPSPEGCLRLRVALLAAALERLWRSLLNRDTEPVRRRLDGEVAALNAGSDGRARGPRGPDQDWVELVLDADLRICALGTGCGLGMDTDEVLGWLLEGTTRPDRTVLRRPLS